MILLAASNESVSMGQCRMLVAAARSVPMEREGYAVDWRDLVELDWNVPSLQE